MLSTLTAYMIRIHFSFYIISSILNINTLYIDINVPCSPEFVLVSSGYRNVFCASTKRHPSLLTSFLESRMNIHSYIWKLLLLCTDTVNLCSNLSHLI
jgi:hypothetical protein